MTFQDFVDVGEFDSYKAAFQWFYRQGQKTSGLKLTEVGKIRLNKIGTTTRVFCHGWNPGENKATHEALLTRELIPFIRRRFEMQRGPNVNQELRPDVTIWVGDQEVHGEIDRDTEGYSFIEYRMGIIANFIDPVIWWAPTETRLAGIMARATPECMFSLIGSGTVMNRAGDEIGVEQFTDRVLQGCSTPEEIFNGGYSTGSFLDCSTEAFGDLSTHEF